MSYPENAYITTKDLLFLGILHDIKKSRIALQPIYEAFTNSIEAIRMKKSIDSGHKGIIKIKIYATETTTDSTEFDRLSIYDNGIGFNEKEFTRFNIYKDFTKGFKNLGSGRIQFIHYFDNSIVRSRFGDGEKFYEREFIVSKKDSFLKNNAIVFHKYCKEIEKIESETTVTFNTLLEPSQLYNTLNELSLKDYLLDRYMHYFCHHKVDLPSINIEFYVQSKLKGKSTISASDIPDVDKKEDVEIPYYKIGADSKSFEKLDKKERFEIDAFKIDKQKLKSNQLNLVSKGEIIEDSDIKLNNLSEGDHVNGYKYLFLVSSNYIDERDTNIRGELKIPTKDSFSKHISLFTNEEIFLEEIQDEVNSKINLMYPEIKEIEEKHNKQLEQIKQMFLIDEETANSVPISINDTEGKILERFYEAEAKKIASIDANIKQSFDKLNTLDTTSDDYTNDLQKEIDELVKIIPQQNKASLTQYVARRKLVLELFSKILKRQLNIQQDGKRNMDEKLLHNLIFQQSASNPEESDLWLVNEDFIYFKGTSEEQLNKIQIHGQFLLKENLTAEEEEFKLSLKENRYTKRPDILLFPEEEKCIIIEFKNPDVNVSEHLNQINNYASLIWNFSNTNFRFSTFYGYLIGEKINAIDVRSYDGDFIEAYNYNYLFRPHKRIAGAFNKADASLYTEVIKYSTLLERAIKRNEIFIKKLTD